MSKILYFLVVVAVIAQVHGGAVPPAADKVEKAAGEAVGQVEKAAAPAEKAAGGAEKELAGTLGIVKPFADAAKTAVEGSEKVINSFVGLGPNPTFPDIL